MSEIVVGLRVLRKRVTHLWIMHSVCVLYRSRRLAGDHSAHSGQPLDGLHPSPNGTAVRDERPNEKVCFGPSVVL